MNINHIFSLIFQRLEDPDNNPGGGGSDNNPGGGNTEGGGTTGGNEGDGLE